MTIQAALMPDGRRLHLQHGPIDLVIEAWGSPAEIAVGYRQATAAFQSVLPDLVTELAQLRRALAIAGAKPQLEGSVARKMVAACWPYRADFITPMAAVAGAVADHILAALLQGRDLAKAYVNNGGDIALWLAARQQLECGLVTDLLAPRVTGVFHLVPEMRIGGIATSGAPGKGRGGRSFSRGIADAVTVLARDAATADAAATMIANAVDLPQHPGIVRVPADSIDPDSDLGDRLVTTEVPALAASEVAAALDRGRCVADELSRSGMIEAAVLALQGEIVLSGSLLRRHLAA
ncbi:MAG TPA: UPF0280 family protein [Dongiaceae bacterium]|nr:UPF0280 family protein [Dongiaceae bacterium]